MALSTNSKAILKRYAASNLEKGSVSFPIELDDDTRTTLHAAAFDPQVTAVRVAVLPEAEPLAAWCKRMQIFHAVVGGFFMRGSGLPAGEVWLRGQPAEAHLGPWADDRGAIYIEGDKLRIAPRKDLPGEPDGDLIQAGPTLVRDGRSVVYDGAPLDGFPETWRRTNDTDITKGRYQRTAIGFNEKRIWAVACDGPFTIPERLKHASPDAGLSLGELADCMLALGCEDALNLDGGGSSSLVSHGRLVNNPRAGIRDKATPGTVLAEGRSIHSAIVFLPR